MTRGELSQAYGILMGASLEKLSVSQRMDVIRSLRASKNEVEDFQDFVNTIREKNADLLKSDKSASIRQLQNEVNAEANKTVESDIAPLDSSLLNLLVESNPKWSPAAIMQIEDVFFTAESK